MSFHPYRRRLFLSVLLPYSLFLRLPFCPAPLLPPAHAAVNPATKLAIRSVCVAAGSTYPEICAHLEILEVECDEK